MHYNGVLDTSNLFRAAWNAGDRAEAWFEITFDTNAERLSGILKRRYLEGELFGIFDNETAGAGFRPSEAEALRIFRMFNKHELQVNGEIATFGGALGAAQAEWNAMTAAYQAAFGEAFGVGQIQALDQEFVPAFNKLKDTYIDVSFLQGVTLAAPFNALSTYAPTKIWVAADTQGVDRYGHGAEVAARTVDRTGKSAADELIFGSLSAQGSLDAAVADTLRGDAGNDWIVSGGGGDLTDGGGGIDIADYSNSPGAVQIDQSDASPETGGFAEGDVLSNVEVIIGSDFADSLTSDALDQIIYGGAGDDTLTATQGSADLLLGGDGDDSLNGNQYADDQSQAQIIYAPELQSYQFSDDTLIGGAGYNTYIAGNGDTIELTSGYDAGRLIINEVTVHLWNFAWSSHGNPSYPFYNWQVFPFYPDTNAEINLWYESATATLFISPGGQSFGWPEPYNPISSLENELTIKITNWQNGDLGIYIPATSPPVADNYQGDAGNDSIAGNGGDDSILGFAGADTLSGGADSDTLNGGDGNDTLRGDEGNDQLFAGIGDDRTEGGIGDDLAQGSNGNDTMLGGDGVDTLGGGSGGDLLRAEAGADLLLGSNGDDRLLGGADADTLQGGAGSDTLWGGAGGDRIEGGDQKDTASYDDALAKVWVRLWAGDGLAGDALGDTLIEIENLTGSPFDDTLVGDDGGNRLDGGAGGDLLSGLDGDDILVGESGADTLTGGAGNEQFWFFVGDGADYIADFSAGSAVGDVIRLFGRGHSVDTFAEMMALAAQQGANVVINLGGGDTITLQNVSLASLNANDFLFG